MSLFVAGLSYRTAPVEVREQLAVSSRHLQCAGCHLQIAAGLSEVVILTTCNRVEIYGVTSSGVQGGIPSLFRRLTGKAIDVEPYLYTFENEGAIRHLFAVVSGLDSMVLGETEIIGQVKTCYQAAQQGELTGPILNRVFQKAFHVAKKIRSTTEVGRGATSVGSVAVELAEKVFDESLAQRTVMIDIAVPRDLDPEILNIPNVYLYDIDDLGSLVREHVWHREQELTRCRAIIEEQTAEVMAKLNSTPRNPYDLRIQPQSGWVLYGASAGCS